MNKYQHLLFDIDNTILDFDTAARLAFFATLRYLGKEPTDAYYETYQAINHACWGLFEQGKLTINEVKKRRWSTTLEHIHIVADPYEINNVYLDKLVDYPILLPNVKPLLYNLSDSGFILHAITNGMKRVQRPRLQAANLTPLFTSVTVSEEIGVAKPHVDFFKHAYQQSGSPPKTELLVIGDNLLTDIVGGNAFQVDTCWLNPTRKTPPTHITPTYTIEQLTDLLGIVANK